MSKVDKHGKEGHGVRGDVPCDDGPLRYKLPRSFHRALSRITRSGEAICTIANMTTAERATYTPIGFCKFKLGSSHSIRPCK
jgi:hypothetical protein